MNSQDRELLQRLGQGVGIEQLCRENEWDVNEFSSWWDRVCAECAPRTTGSVALPVQSPATIRRDKYGIPHIYADSQIDLYTAFGFAMAQDRLFQLDYLRRKGAGRLAEILGSDGFENDQLARTVGLRRLAQDELPQLQDEVAARLAAFSNGVNQFIDQLRQADAGWPIEFELLDYRPESWEPVDCLTIECEFQWYLTGRLPVIVNPELAKRTLGDTDLYREFLLGEADEECIIPPGNYPTASDGACEDVGQTMGGPDDGVGSNNWAAAGRLTASRAAMVASDPHIAIEAVSCWYEVHLEGGGLDVSGACYVGMPAVMFGRNQNVAWTITNNICSQRDLYLEKPSDDDRDCFLFDGEYERCGKTNERIVVKNEADREIVVRFTRHGPIIDDLIAEPARSANPVSLRWVRFHGGGWLTSLMEMNRSDSIDAFREALKPWFCPTFSLVFADVAGDIRFRNSGRLPLRSRVDRAMRAGDQPTDQWRGFIPFDAMPEWTNPERGWLGTANNRVTGDDFAYPLGGTFVRGHRGVRIREMFADRSERPLTRDDFRHMHQDTDSVRGRERRDALVQTLRDSSSADAQVAADILASWDFQVEADSVGATVFNVFFFEWVGVVCAERFEDPTVLQVVRASGEAVSARLLTGDRLGWFHRNERTTAIVQAMESAFAQLREMLGEDSGQWAWGKLHRLRLPHALNGRGDLGQLLNGGDEGVKGDMGTICNTGQGPGFSAATGAGFRMVADLSTRQMWSVDGQSQSGNPGSPHYRDQLPLWLDGDYHPLPAPEDETDEILRVDPS